MGFSRQEYRSGLPFPSPGDLPNPGTCLHCRQTLYPLSHQRSPQKKQIFLTKPPTDSSPHPQHPPRRIVQYIWSFCWPVGFSIHIHYYRKRYSLESDSLIFFLNKNFTQYFKYQERARRSVMVWEQYLVPLSSINCYRTPFTYRNARRCIMVLSGLFPPLKYSPWE